MVKPIKQFNLRVAQDDPILDWLNAQDSVSVSLKLLIRHTLRQGGAIDFPEALADGFFDSADTRETVIVNQPKRRTRQRREVTEFDVLDVPDVVGKAEKPEKVVKPEKPMIPEKPLSVETVVVPERVQPTTVPKGNIITETETIEPHRPDTVDPVVNATTPTTSGLTPTAINPLISFGEASKPNGALDAMFDNLIQQQQNDN